MDYLSIILLGNAAFLVALLIGQVIYRTKVHGTEYALGNLDQAKLEMCESRLLRVKNNQQETLTLVVSITALALMTSTPNSSMLFMVSIIHIISRAMYISAALRGVPVVRSVLWIISLFCLGIMMFHII